MALSRALKKIFEKKPLISNCVIYGSLYVGAEFSQQVITRKILTTPPENIDLPTLGRYLIVGSTMYSPILFYWYKWLDRKLPGNAMRKVIRKVILDQFILTPVLLVVFFVAMSALERKPNPFEECQKKFLPTFYRSCAFWLPMQMINFTFVPPNFRVIYVGTCAFAWVNILCIMKRKPIDEVEN